MREPKISIIVPVYNALPHLQECIDSVLSQTLKDIEIICINDGSTDSSLEVLKNYPKDNRIVLLDQKNMGVGITRNNGIKAAKGEYVIFLDPDDFYPISSVLQKLYSKATSNKALICGGSHSLVRQGVVRERFYGRNYKYKFEKGGFVDFINHQFDYGFHRFLYDKKMLLAHNIFFPSYIRFQDPPFFIQAMITAKTFYAIPDTVYRYRCGHRKVTWSDKKILDLIKGLRENLRLSLEHNLMDLFQLTVERIYFEHYYRDIAISIKKWKFGGAKTA